MIAIIVGHTQSSPGACAPDGSVCEFAFNEPIAQAVVNELEAAGLAAQVVYRDEPNRYVNLPHKVNRLDPDFIVSLHANAAGEFATGTEMLYWHDSEKGEVLARTLQRHVVAAMGLRDRGVKPRQSHHRGSHLLRSTRAPCVITEPFFISNMKDLRRARARKTELVQAYVESIQHYAGG